MSTKVCLVVIILCYNILADRELVFELGSKACPYTNFCHTHAWKIMPNNTKYEPCCTPCSCDDDCWELDNCCPDKDLADKTITHIVPCIDSYVKLRPANRDINPYKGFYRVVDTCPISEERLNFEPKCIRENRTTLNDLIWVSDKTGKIYQNIYCARCHGIKDPIKWQIQSTCFDIMLAKFDNFADVLLSENCNLINTVPEDLQSITKKYTCISPETLKFTSCNQTGLMTSYNPALEIACKQSNWPYLPSNFMVKNVFCAMCNDERLVADELCDYQHINKGTKEVFTFLIDYTSLQAELIEVDSSCEMDEIFDKFLGLCRKLRCPIGTAPLYGRCKQLVSKMNGYVVNVQFYLDIIWNQTSLFPLQKHDTMWSVIYAQFLELADLNTNCEICQNIIDLTENSDSDLILVVTFKFNSECDYSLALAKMAGMQGKLIEIHINGVVVLTLLVQSDKLPSKVYKQEGLQTVLYHNFNDCDPAHALSFDDITCPRLMLTSSEIQLISHTGNKQKDIFASFFMGNGTQQSMTRVSVCLDDYILAMSLNRASPFYYSKMGVQLMLMQLLLLHVM